MLSVLVAAAALAQSITVDPGVAFSGQGFSSAGVGAPSVAWDPVQERYIMAFETKTGASDANCPEGYWSIGVASSEDGYSWTQWNTAAVSPTPGTPWSCFAVHPALVRGDDGTYHLWFKAGQGHDAKVNPPAWGDKLHPGIGKVSGIIELDDKSDEITALQADVGLLDQQIDQVLTTIGAASSSFLNTLTSSSALECVNYADVCSPCISFRLEATHTAGGGSVFDQKDLCQAFDFVIPGTIGVSAGASGGGGNFAYLRFSGQNAPSECRYMGSNQPGHYTKQVAKGNCVNPFDVHSVELEIAGSSFQNTPTTAFVVLEDFTGAQTWQGPGYDTLVALDNAAAGLDEGAVLHAEDALLVLADLRAQLAGLGTVGAAALDTAAGNLETALNQAITDYDLLDADRQVLLDDIADLQAYQPKVALTGPGTLSLQVHRGAYPSVVKVGNTWHMQVQVKRHLRAATSADGQNFTLTGSGSILADAAVAWAQTELLSPSLTCGAPGPDRFRSILVGRTTINDIPGGPVQAGSVTDAESSDFVSWLLDTVGWGGGGFVGDTDWRHVDVLRQGSDYRIWLSEISGNQSVIRTASVGATSNTGGEGRVCP